MSYAYFAGVTKPSPIATIAIPPMIMTVGRVIAIIFRAAPANLEFWSKGTRNRRRAVRYSSSSSGRRRGIDHKPAPRNTSPKRR